MSKKRKPPKNDYEIISGILRMHPKGFGFVIPDPVHGLTEDVFIPKHLTNTAVDSDQVEVAVFTTPRSERGPEGKIVTILKRSREHVCGILQKELAPLSFIAYVPLLGTSKPVKVTAKKEQRVEVGSRVILKIKEWGSNTEPTTADILHCLGSIDDPSCDIEAAIEEFDLPEKFPQAAIKQAKAYGSKVLAKELQKREDLTKLTCFTIDPETAKDFDDALNISQDKKGNYHLGVHIADVAHYVPVGSALDKEAYKRANSTYLPGTCIPMLPEELSNELCSLQAKKNRLTVSVLMDFDKQGNLLSSRVVRSVIHSRKRFTYEEAKEVLDGKKKSVHKGALQKMVKLCHLLKQKRKERGSIDFSMTEFVLVIDKKGEVKGVKKVEYDITHQMVEEFMLKANELVAIELKNRNKELIYRVHEEPHEENFSDFMALARQLGFTLSSQPEPQELQQLFKQAQNTPYLHQLSVAFIRSMRLAQYSPDNVGHFGLALEHYCHFTSPIRRYSDLIIQRLLFDEEGKHLPLEQIAKHCSDQERVSFRAEMGVKTLKKLRLLKRYFQEDPLRVYPALITKVKSFGCFFEVQELMLEGFLHISEVGNDYFIYQEHKGRLVGKHTGKTYGIGDPIEVRLQDLDLISLQTRWEIPSLHPSKKRKKR